MSILIGVLAAHCVSIRGLLTRERGNHRYLGAALARIWYWNVSIVILECALAYIMLAMTRGFLGGGSGLLAAYAFLLAFGLGVIPDQTLSKGVLGAGALKLLARPTLFSFRSNVLRSIAELRQQEFRQFHLGSGGWAEGTTLAQRLQRLRILWEIHKVDIAKVEGRPDLLEYREVKSGWTFFWLLDFFGAPRLREVLSKDTEIIPGWDGRERRRRKGTVRDRASRTDDAETLRRSDYLSDLGALSALGAKDLSTIENVVASISQDVEEADEKLGRLEAEVARFTEEASTR